MASDSPGQRALPRGRPARAAAIRRGLLHTIPGRLLIIGGAVKLTTWLLRIAFGIAVPLLDAAGSIGSLAVIAGLAYFLYKLLVRAKRRLLWRVRRKLILSYIFVGVVPVLLVVAFFLLSGLLMFLNVGAYLVVSSIHSVSDDALLLARAGASDLSRAGLNDARDVLERKLATFSRDYPDASIALVPTSAEPCAGEAADILPSPRKGGAAGTPPVNRPAVVAVGPWAHLAPPQVLPSWVSCTGFAGLLAVSVPSSDAEDGVGLMIRSIALPRSPSPAYGVVVDVPLDTMLKTNIRERTSVKLGPISVSRESTPSAIDTGKHAASLLGLGPIETAAKRRFPWVASLEWHDWATGRTEGASIHLEMNLRDIYERVSSAQFNGSAMATRFLLALAVFAGLFLIIEVVALVVGLVLAKSITGSVHQLFRGTERVRQGDFSHKIRITSRDQMGELAESFNSMTGSIEDLLREAQEKKRLEEELRIARAIQMSLLPRGELDAPGLSITALCVPAREVGGDYYDLLPLGDGRLGVLIADVAGKGTSAALYMAELKGLVLSLCRIHTSPRKLLIEANRIIADNLDSRSFITMTYAVLDRASGTMTYARAGHTPLIRRRADTDGRAVQVMAPDGLVVGLKMGDNGALFERLLREETVPLREGDLYMFFTDGITEAMNAASDCFGEGRLGDILAEHGDLPSEELRERILREIDAFVAGAPQHDDMTMILVKVESMGMAVEQPAPVTRAIIGE